MYGLTLVTAPAQPAIDRETEAKKHLRIDAGVNDENALLDALIRAAANYFERATNRLLITQTWKLTLDKFPGALAGDDWPAIRLPHSPVQSITSISYVDTAGATQTLAAAKYLAELTSLPPRIAPAYGDIWPSTRLQPGAINVTYVAGYGATYTSVPEDDKAALKMLLAHWYANREAVGAAMSEQPLGLQAILASKWDGAYAEIG